MKYYNRRTFLKTSIIGGAAIPFIYRSDPFALCFDGAVKSTCVSLTTGKERADMVFRALSPFADEIKSAIGSRRVVLKVNNVLIYVPLACTHVDTLEGILEFLKSINKHRNVIIAESSASDSTLSGFENYGYNKLLSKYPVKLVDLDNEGFEMMHVTDERDFRPHMIKVSSIITDPESYIISVARMKIHNTVGATLSLKNIVFGSPIKDKGFTLYNEDKRFSERAKESKPGSVSYKRLLHGGGFYAVNYNMATLAQKLHPHLAVIDGLQGMEGNGPVDGDPVQMDLIVAGRDVVAVDATCCRVMGFDPHKVKHVLRAHERGLGEIDDVEMVGERVETVKRRFKPA